MPVSNGKFAGAVGRPYDKWPKFSDDTRWFNHISHAVARFATGPTRRPRRLHAPDRSQEVVYTSFQTGCLLSETLRDI